jgi:endonuclease/exonuclease/phosphatase family metal-dependent hydrolase
MNPTPELTKRIDYILYRGSLETALAVVVGDEVMDRTAAGLWPSDHAGVLATLRVR